MCGYFWRRKNRSVVYNIFVTKCKFNVKPGGKPQRPSRRSNRHQTTQNTPLTLSRTVH